MPRLLIVIGILLIALGIMWLTAEKLGLGRLPGDIVIERDGLRIHIPLMTCVIVSVILSLLVWLFHR